MSIEKIINITVNTKGSDKALAQTAQLNNKLNQLKATTGEVAKGFKGSGNAILENGGAMGLLNDATGGYAMTVKDAVEATGLFSKGTIIATSAQKIYTLVVGSTTGALKALRIALVSTGLGAIVVLLGLFISKMMESAEATEAQKAAQEAYNLTLERTNALYKESISSLESFGKEAVLRAKIAGKSTEELAKIEKELEAERYQNYVNERRRLENALKDKNLTTEQAKEINKQLTENQREYFKRQEQERTKDLEDELSVVDAKRQAQKELLEKQAEDRAKAREEEAKKLKEYNESLAKGLIDLQIATNEAEFEQRNEELENRKRQSDEIAKIAEKEQKDRDAELEAEKRREETIQNMKVNIRTNTQNLLLALFKKGSAVSKGIAIAEIVREQVKSISASISNLTVANAKAVAASPLTGGQPFVGLNTAQTVTGIALSAATAAKSIKDILSDGKSAGSANVGSGGGGGGGTPAPSFNLVQGTGTNQIAEGLASSKKPIKAFVVSSEQTTAEAIDRNIVSEASIG